jgi:hypothetical protein
MKLWVVFISGRFADNCNERWIDSMWAAGGNARNRVIEVRDSMRACGATRFEVSYTQTTKVADTRIVETPAKRSHHKAKEVVTKPEK